ncbi:helix-turn-helix and ligand-binding sensor domain-containing protein [Cellulophaga omnivescoria]|uniref:helix-turn-helix and ligand-binding sensor domain-containing protein n=1 Tax=Cellulophaga omnivescoria TaxID=1888890 RepID=UPI0009842540|nr:triple tyrosine motif-containing protein [Cellulophaga omnivescoria]WBU89370.1 triple tyrosine motif-containing protein [Cellulophaga omnivescoria]WKB81394.1 triple tyrosine motif-containing protein [Cellulophaga lytica]
MLLKKIAAFSFFLLCFVLKAQEFPPISIITPQEYAAENQNWDISQNQDNLIYLANNGGLLEYNGADWKLYAVPNNSIVRSVKAIGSKIFTGSFMDFGYWQKNALGVLEYYSLKESLNLQLLDGEQFWNIEKVDGWMIFQSLSRIYLINLEKKEVKCINAKGTIGKMIYVNNTLYYQELGVGLFKIENEKRKLVNNSNFFKENKIITIFKQNNQLLYLTENNGFFTITNNLPVKWQSILDTEKLSIYNAIKLQDNSIVLGTISNGVYFLNKDGSFNYKLTRQKGISNNTVLSLFQDSYKNIWLGLDNGINFINNSSRFNVFTDNDGQLGTVYTSIVHNGYMYLGTNQGLFYKDVTKQTNFSFIQGTKGQVWMLKTIDNTLFCGHDKGTLIIDNNTVIKQISNSPGTWDFKPINKDKSLVLQGNYNGLHVLKKQNGSWEYKNRLEGLNMSSRFFENIGNTIYVNHELKGLYKLKVDADYKKVLYKEYLSVSKEGSGSNIIKFNGNLLYSSSQGIFTLKNNEFVKDSIYTNLFKDYSSLTTLMKIKEDSTKLWRFADDNISILNFGSISNEPKLTNIPVARNLVNSVAGFENMTQVGGIGYLVGTSNGYLLLNNLNTANTENLNININAVEVYKRDEPKIRINLQKNSALKNKQNNIVFYYSFPFFNTIVKNEYQYQLKGLSNKWSNWSQNTSQLFENLPYGEYTFNVRGKSGNNITNTVSYTFTIDRPFYLSNLAIAIYIFACVLLFKLIDVYYKNKQKRALLKTQQKLSRKELENKQQLTQLNNEKLKLDIENKNRELAISTMSIIRKNEFLNTIKKELIKANLGNKVSSVIKIIDKNINNTDDWKLFQEAFNNADKDFLNKIKAKHSALTPNDLKLCAYLRLNLSSKEIAPLLNISPRSVEVKRYRLRKKMNLPHETSLTSYILEL